MKKILITGGNGDISIAIIKLLESLNEYEIFAPGKNQLDVTNVDNIEEYFKDKYFDVIVNNAGYIVPKSITESPVSNYLTTLNVNLMGTFHITNRALKANPKAYIINIGSSAATKSHANWSAYCAAKAAVVMATECWAEEGVQAICLSPGRTATKMREALFPKEDKKTLLNPNDFAKVVIKALNFEYELGSNINVNVKTIGGLLNG